MFPFRLRDFAQIFAALGAVPGKRGHLLNPGANDAIPSPYRVHDRHPQAVYASTEVPAQVVGP